MDTLRVPEVNMDTMKRKNTITDTIYPRIPGEESGIRLRPSQCLKGLKSRLSRGGTT